MLYALIRWLGRTAPARGGARRSPARARRCRPQLERMEERSLPSITLPAALSPPTTITAVLGSPEANKTTGTQTDRLFRDGLVPTCATPKTFPGTIPAGPITFDDFTLANTSATPTCVEVTYRAVTGNGAGIFAAAYLGSFNPANISQNWLSDAGFSPGTSAVTFSFMLPASQALHLVFNDTMAGGTFVGDTYRFTVANGIKFAPLPLPVVPVGAFFRQQVTASGGDGPKTLSVTAGALPPGVTLNPKTGVLQGTPKAAGTYRFRITATDAMGETATHEYTLVVFTPVRLVRRYNR